MKLEIKYWRITCLILVVFIASLSCRKSDRDKDTETVSSLDNAMAEMFFMDAFEQVHSFAMKDSLLNDTGLVFSIDGCVNSAVLSDTLAIFPLDLDMDFGENNDQCDDKRKRKGRILANFSGKYKATGTVVTITFDHYHVNDIEVSGTLVVTVNGFNEQGKRVYTFQVTDGTLSGLTVDVEWHCIRELEWTAGGATEEDVSDDVFFVTGNSWGRNTRGNTFLSEITSAMRYNMECNWFVSGKQELRVPNLSLRFLDYGNGSCDNTITATRDATDLQVGLP